MNGTKQMAQRIVNAEQNFVQMIMEKGFNREDAFKAMRTMLKLKVAKLDPIIGRISVKHGVYLERNSIQNAINFEKN